MQNQGSGEGVKPILKRPGSAAAGNGNKRKPNLVWDEKNLQGNEEMKVPSVPTSFSFVDKNSATPLTVLIYFARLKWVPE